MRSLFFVAFSLAFVSSFSQEKWDKKQHDFGPLDAYTPRYVDFTLSNTNDKEFIIFSIRKPKEVKSLTSNKFVKPDSSSTIRFQVNPKRTGKFDYRVEVFTSNRNDAHIIHLEGNVVELSANEMHLDIPCPGFGSTPPGTNPFSFNLTVQTIDKETKESLSNSTVNFLQKGRPVWEKQSNNKGVIKTPAQLGLSYFTAKHEGYLPTEKGAYINFKRNIVVLELEKDTVKKMPIHADAITDVSEMDTVPWERFELEQEDTSSLPMEQVVKILRDHSSADQFDTVPHVFGVIDPNNFDDKYFKPVNVVFILDISMSMRHADRIELMKYSLIQLSEMLRQQDLFSVVTYASNVELLLSPTSGMEKDSIQNKISNLNAGGFTSGGLGIKLGFKTAKSAQIQDGLNHVIIITDGGFNRDSDNYKKVIKKYRKKGITFSVVGVKNNPKVELEMRDAAQLGGGEYIPINNLEDAKTNLKQEIRQKAFLY